MTTSETDKKTGGAIADALTVVRLILTPVIMFVIIKGWPDVGMALLASALFVVAAVTDFFDDHFGGTENAPNRQFGWFDDIADIVLIIGALSALMYVLNNNGLLKWPFLVPASIIIGREIIVGLAKGYEMAKSGWPETKFSNIKNFLLILAVLVLVASPWLTQFVDGLRAGKENAMAVYDNASPLVWMTGEILLWLAALMSLITGVMILRTKADDLNGGE